MGTQKPRRSGAPAKKAPRAPAKSKKQGTGEVKPAQPDSAGSSPAPAPRKRANSSSKKAPAAKKAPSPRKSPKPGAATQPVSGHYDRHTPAERAALAAKGAKPLELNRILTAEGVPDPEGALHPRVKAFADEYLRDLNGTAAYLRIHPTASVRTAGTESWRLLKNPEVRRYVDAKRQRIALSIDFSREDWLREQLAVVLADPSELTQMRCVACADCWPKEREPATPEEAKRKRDDEKGRLRYDDWLEPDPECMTCHGEGSPRVWFADTRKLSPAAKALFLSAYKTKDGIRIELRDKDAALERLGRALGVYEKDNEQKGKGAAEALRDLFSGLHQHARLKAVREEPQAKPAAPSGNPLVRG